MRRVAIAALWLAIASASADALAVTLKDDRGVTITVADPPARIVSLLPSITESVCALNACPLLVGTDRFSNWPSAVRALPKLGGIDDIQVERIVALRPDVVLAPRSIRAVERLEALGVSVVVFDSQTHADVRRSLETIATLLGTPKEAERVWAGIEKDIATAATRVPSATRGRTIYVGIGSTGYAAGSSSFVGETLARLGMANVIPAAMGPFPRLNPEYVIRHDPDIVIAPDREFAEMRTRPGWDRLHALRDGQTCRFGPDRFEVLIRPGPRLGEAALSLADCLAHLPPRP